MAEIRKFDPAAGNAIAQALKAAMGEPVRPREPGRAPASQAPEAQPSTTAWISLQVAPAEEKDED
jgi:hypothetical protein